MIKIGLVSIDTSHPKSFAQYLQSGKRAKYHAVYNNSFRGDDELNAFIKEYDVDYKCSTLEELVKCSDIGFIQSCNWDRHLEQAMPFIKSNKPVFIDKPLVGSMKDLTKLKELENEGHVIFGGSTLRYSPDTFEILESISTEKSDLIHIQGIAGGHDFFYAINLVEAICGLLADKAVSAKYLGRSSAGAQLCDSYMVFFTNGTTSIYSVLKDKWVPFDLSVLTSKSTYKIRIDTKKTYTETIDRICDYMEGKNVDLAGVNSLSESIQIMFAGKISKDNGGKEVLLKDIPKDFADPDGYEFEQTYIKNASKIYI